MKKINCLIIEDQIPAQEILTEYITQVPNLHLVGALVSPIDARFLIEGGEIDLLFLDIHLPKLSGIELLKSLKNVPSTILTTAFSDYAVEGFNLDVIDYLLKPFSFDRFLKALSKVPSQDEYVRRDTQSNQIFVKNKGQIERIVVSSINYLEAKGDFTLIHHNDGRIIANRSLTKLLDVLDTNFIRCHKSFIVNIESIDRIIGNMVLIREQQIPVGRHYKLELMDKLDMI